MLDDDDLCKLIYYTENNPLNQDAINGEKHLSDKRLLTFRSKIPLAASEGVYVLVRVPNMRPSSGGGYYISSLLVFDIYCHVDIKTIYDRNGNKMDRTLLIASRIEQIMKELDIGIGKDSFNGGGEVSNNDGTFQGFSMGYVNVDFRR